MRISKPSIVFGFSIVLAVALLFIGGKEKFAPRNEAVGKIGTAEALKPAAIGNISYNQAQKDSSIDAIIDSPQKPDNGNLLVTFHHNSTKEEPVSVIEAIA